MYLNLGSKLKRIAKVLFIVLLAAVELAGLLAIAAPVGFAGGIAASARTFLGVGRIVLAMILAPGILWLLSVPLFILGHIVENSDIRTDLAVRGAAGDAPYRPEPQQQAQPAWEQPAWQQPQQQPEPPAWPDEPAAPAWPADDGQGAWQGAGDAQDGGWQQGGQDWNNGDDNGWNGGGGGAQQAGNDWANGGAQNPGWQGGADQTPDTDWSNPAGRGDRGNYN